MKPKFGVIGCGSISRFHFAGFEKAGIEVAHVSDVNEDAAKPYAEKFSAKFSKDYKELLADPDVTAVSVLTSGKFHREICLAAVEAGRHIICEKTMADNVSEAVEIVKAVKAADVLFFTAFMKRFFPAAKKAKELMASLGTIFSAQVRSYQGWGLNFFDMDSADEYRWILDSYGGAVVKCAGSHMIDMTLYLLGRPQSLYANIDYLGDSKFDRKATALFEYDSGMIAAFETTAHPLKRIGYERNSWDEFIQINGVNGRLELYTVQWDKPENNAPLLVHYDNEKETTAEYRFEPANPFDRQVAYFCDCIENRQQGNPDVIDGFNVDVIIETMTKSSSKKASVAIDWMGL
jgi:predicted dehydrogenase